MTDLGSRKTISQIHSFRKHMPTPQGRPSRALRISKDKIPTNVLGFGIRSEKYSYLENTPIADYVGNEEKHGIEFHGLIEDLNAWVVEHIRPYQPQPHLRTGHVYKPSLKEEDRTTRDTETRKIFFENVEKWQRETMFSSSSEEMILHRAYQRIIGLGKPALPFIFEQLQKDTGPWSFALEAITGEDPVSAEDIGDQEAIANAWLKWAKLNGYIPTGE